MFFRPLRRSRPSSIQNAISLARRSLNHTAAFPTIPKCPAATCRCSATPEMPEGLPIDYSKPLNGTMAGYSEQVLVCTGQNDWVSRIEEENSGDNLAADIKELMGRGGVYSDPYNNVSVLNASFPSSVPSRQEIQNTSAYLLPSFKYVPFLPRVSFSSVQALVQGFLLPTELHPAHDALSPIHRDRLSRSIEQQSFLYGVQDVKDVLVLICGHGGRDARCGIYGPLLQAEFETILPTKDFEVLKAPIEVLSPQQDNLLPGGIQESAKTARVGLISHIGGHNFAGNVIVYIPPGARSANGKPHALAGCGIWYGRIEPKHVEGIVQETILEGKVIEENFRGGIRQGGEILRL
ncbi:Altered inheritance of mitochondria protein 32 [Phlyctema vagabunda]|uniref:Altered inheritance of mitochondria protein 32 n=1 Tax=Phlyctema vagabunda TaxID=108571 RepID=A0ABR4PHI0_9HELO